MTTLFVRDWLQDPILVSRESARPLVAAIREALLEAGLGGEADVPLLVDFQGVEGIAPSFMDELLSAFELGAEGHDRARSVVVANPPTRLSLKFEAIARGRGMSIATRADGSWLLAGRPSSEPAGGASKRAARDR